MTARLEHVPGDKVSGDWTGDCPHLTDPVTGRRMKAQVFVAVLPYSGLIFAQATPDRRMFLVKLVFRFGGGDVLLDSGVLVL